MEVLLHVVKVSPRYSSCSSLKLLFFHRYCVGPVDLIYCIWQKLPFFWISVPEPHCKFSHAITRQKLQQVVLQHSPDHKLLVGRLHASPVDAKPNKRKNAIRHLHISGPAHRELPLHRGHREHFPCQRLLWIVRVVDLESLQLILLFVGQGAQNLLDRLLVIFLTQLKVRIKVQSESTLCLIISQLCQVFDGLRLQYGALRHHIQLILDAIRHLLLLRHYVVVILDLHLLRKVRRAAGDRFLVFVEQKLSKVNFSWCLDSIRSRAVDGI